MVLGWESAFDHGAKNNELQSCRILGCKSIKCCLDYSEFLHQVVLYFRGYLGSWSWSQSSHCCALIATDLDIFPSRPGYSIFDANLANMPLLIHAGRSTKSISLVYDRDAAKLHEEKPYVQRPTRRIQDLILVVSAISTARRRLYSKKTLVAMRVPRLSKLDK